MDKQKIQDLYEEGVITKSEMFILWHKHDIEYTDEFKEEYLSWRKSIANGSVTFSIWA